MALVRHAFPDAAARGRAIAIWAMGGAIASSSGPVLGGMLSLASWRLIFLINIPVAAVTLLVLARTRPNPTHHVAFDWAGQITAVLAMSGLTFGVIEGGAGGFTRLDVIVALAVAAVAATAFLAVQARVKHPMVPMALFRSATFDIAVVIGFAFMVGYYGTPFLFSLYFQSERGLSSLIAGLAFLPMMLIGAALTPFSARIVERTGPRVPIVTGLVLLAAGAAVLATVPASTPVWALALLLILVGLAGPLVMPPTTAALLSSVPAGRSGVASGVFNTSRQVGGALAVAVFGALTATAGGFLHGQRISLTITAGVALASAAAALALKSRPAPKETS
jgi:DHA2 family methylenomycin A resistance protein-like MFS transporter